MHTHHMPSSARNFWYARSLVLSGVAGAGAGAGAEEAGCAGWEGASAADEAGLGSDVCRRGNLREEIVK